MKKLLASALWAFSFLPPVQAADAHKEASHSHPVPKLIIGISVDQLRTDYLLSLQSRMSEGGFNRLLNGGRVYEQVTFDINNPDATTALAILATGSYPFSNGITASRVFNPATLHEQDIFSDAKYIGNFTEDNYSPAALLSTTLSDELKTATNGVARIFSIAPNASAAIIGAGHTANCALWIDDKTGKWASSTFYRDFPHYITRYNKNDAPHNGLELLHWQPSFDTENSKDNKLEILPYHYSTSNYFDHQFLYFRQPSIPMFKTSGLVNEAVTKLCKVFVNNGGLGRSISTDMLQVTYYAGTYEGERPEIYASELQDTYLRLDKTLAELLDAVDATVGLEHTFIYLTSTGDTNPRKTNVEGLAAGEFNANRCTALLNSYLMSVYGPGSWVNGWNNNQIYLNHKVIEDKQLRLREVQQTASEFVTLFSGVQEVVTAHQMLHEDSSARVQKMRNGYHKQTSGDLYVILQTGWSLKLNDTAQTQSQTRHDVAPGPAIFFAPGNIKSERITTPIDATSIAPTVARIIRIRAPSACTTAPLLMNTTR